jgi:prephenate dehydratase
MKIAVLGPPGTFTEKAAEKYMNIRQLDGVLNYYSTLHKTMHSIGNECVLGVIPVENTLDGFVQIILDQLALTHLQIIHELVLPIRFGFIANVETMNQVHTMHVQFKTNNQCLEFLENHHSIDVITTPSNSASYDAVLKGETGTGAIVPMHIIDQLKANPNPQIPLIIEDIADSMDNETRFLVLAKEMDHWEELEHEWKTLIMIEENSDRPGLLAGILGIFGKYGINLKSIISRPTKARLGEYNFFIDIDACYLRDTNAKKAIDEINKEFNIRILGSYYRVE